MTLIELYNLKLNEYKETGVRERPWKLLAMLLLSEINKYEPARNSRGEFYKKYKDEIDKKIAKVERDFNFTYEDIVEYIERIVVCDNYEYQRIWFVFEDGFGALSWGLMYREEKTAEEIYSEYFENDELKKDYDIEERAIANNISITKLDNLLNRIVANPNDFYKIICDELTAEERVFILKQLENKCCMNCTNGSCRVEYDEKVGVDEFGKPRGSECVGWFNAELIGRSKVLRKTDINKLR